MKPNNRKELILNIFTIFIIPVYTILLASQADWLSSNLSVIGNYVTKRSAFFIWGVTIGSYFLVFIQYLYQKVNYQNRWSILFLYLSCIFLYLSVCTPYLPQISPFQSYLHVFFAFFSPIFLLLSILCFVFYLWKQNHYLFSASFFYLVIITIFSILLLVKVGYVSSLLEIFITISTSFFLKDLSKRIYRLTRED